ncbi:MAG: hypothetical protein WC519_03000 [Parcubacteria group bacterium]
MADNLGTSRGAIPWKALVFSAVVFGLAIIVYAGLTFGYKPFVSASIKSAEDRMAELDYIAPQGEAEAEFVQFYSQLTNIKNLLSAHVAVMPFFNMLETNTMADVGFSGATINVLTKMANMSGFAKSYDVLAGQMAVYESALGVNKVTISSARLADELVRFELRADLSPDLFKFIPPTVPPIEQPIEQPNS